MIISRPKPFEEILHLLGEKSKVFLIGCGLCATLCQSGGEEQVNEMKDRLMAEGKEITGQVVIEAVCHILSTKKELRAFKAALAQSQVIMVMACGAGVQSVSEIQKIPTLGALDTLFLGNVKRFGHFEERCSLCGECVLSKTGGICPVTTCSKGLLNGPCGGMNNGKCELDPERDCGWVKIYERCEELGQLETIAEIFPPKNFSKGTKPQTLMVKNTREGE